MMALLDAGLHAHPHGLELVLGAVLLVALVLAACAVFVALRGRR